MQVPGAEFLKLAEGLAPRDRVPCGMLDSGALNFHADGTITACGCHYSQALGNQSLDLGTIETPLTTLTERREELILDWRRRNVVPEVCRSCQHYHIHDGLHKNGLMLVAPDPAELHGET